MNRGVAPEGYAYKADQDQGIQKVRFVGIQITQDCRSSPSYQSQISHIQSKSNRLVKSLHEYRFYLISLGGNEIVQNFYFSLKLCS